MVSLDKTLIVQVLTFLIIMFVLNRILFKDMVGLVVGREERLKEGEKEIKEFVERAESLRNEYEERIREGRMKAMEERDRLIREGIEEGNEILKRANKEMERMLSEFNERLKIEKERARELLNSELYNLSLRIAEKILGRELGL